MSKLRNNLNVLRAKVREWNEWHGTAPLKEGITVWGNALLKLATSSLLVVAVYAAVRLMLMPGEPWTMCAMALLVFTIAVVLKML